MAAQQLCEGHDCTIRTAEKTFITEVFFIDWLQMCFSRWCQPLDLCVAGLFKTIYYNERKSKAMKGETRKIYPALLAFYKATIIPMVRWSFERAGFLLDIENIRNPVQIVPSRVLVRISIPNFEIMICSFTLAR
jgi:hypothetical protein